jgi:glycosyltransferase involved in cell wall biosynthesis
MKQETSFERVLRALARRDPRDRAKWLILTAAALREMLRGDLRAARCYFSHAGPARKRGAEDLASDPPQQPEDRVYLSSCVKLFQYSFPAADSGVGTMGHGGQPFVRELAQLGYSRGEVLDLKPAGAVETLRNIRQLHSRLCLFGMLEHVPAIQLDAFVEQLARLSDGWIIAAIPTYPESMFDSSQGRPAGIVFERRAWWIALFERHGFEPQPVRETLPGIEPFLFRKRASSIRPFAPPRAAAGKPDLAIALPHQQNAFRWVCEALAEAVQDEGVGARISLPAGWKHDTAEARRTLTWAHYWTDYREAARSLNPDLEYFVTNFSFERSENLTPWLAELCARPSRKITPSTFAKSALVDLGAPAERVEIVPHGYSPEFVNPPKALPLATRKSFRLLAVVNSYDPYRYGTDLLLAAYRKAFRHDDDVCLVIKDYGATSGLMRTFLEQEQGPEVLYYANFLSKDDLAAFYAAASVFVAPFRGEGFGIKIIDAAAMGLPLIVPLFGGPADYCLPGLVQPVQYRLQPVGRCLETDELRWNEQLIWCEPDTDDLAAQMRHVYQNQEEARRRASRLREHVLERFSWRAAAQALIRCMDLP